MKHAVVVLSGVADVPASALGGRTPLQAARTTHLDRLSRAGKLGRVATAPRGAFSGSDVALLTLLGFDPRQYPIRRGPLEAAGAGIAVARDDLVLRGNFVSIWQDAIVDVAAGRVTSGEAEVLLRELGRAAADDGITLHPLGRYRFLLVLRGGKALELRTEPLHAAVGRAVGDVYPHGPDAGRLTRFLDAARSLLAGHDINKVRIDLGENPANFVWPWGEGSDLDLPSFEGRYGRKGASVAGAALARGVARKLGFTAIDAPGANGDLDTDLTAKAEAARRALDGHDFLFAHVQGANEASHMRDPKVKVGFIEEVDSKFVRPLAEALERHGEWRLLVASDHVSATETDEPSYGKAPFLIAGSDLTTIREYPFDEEHAERSDLQIDDGPSLIEYFLKA